MRVTEFRYESFLGSSHTSANPEKANPEYVAKCSTLNEHVLDL